LATSAQPEGDLATRPRTVHVLGAGIAGAAAARAFAARGCEVTVVAPRGVADGASGVPAAAVRPRLWRDSGQAVPDAEILADAFRWTSRWLSEAAPARFRACGVLVCAVDADDEAQVRARAENPATADVVQWRSAAAAAEHAGLALPFGAAWIPSGGFVALSGLVRDLLLTPGVTVRPAPPSDEPDLTVDARARIPGGEVVRGQAIGLHLADAAPRCVVCTNGYLCPPSADGLTWLGSTYDRHDDATDERPGDDERVLSRFDPLPALASALRRAPTAARFVGVRASAPQRIARIGFATTKRAVTLGHGSRGAVTGPWAGELLAAAAFGEQLPATEAQWSRLQARARA
jgi:tRNA 5-methylaminomethyl-2-thiouridine biosynthesis bifunctional protein